MEEAAKQVKEYLSSYGLGERVMEFDTSSATVELAAKAVGVIPAQIAKTISFVARDGYGCILIVTSGDCKIENHKFKETFGMKAKMLLASQVEPLTGHPIGGVSPFLYPPCAKVYLDQSLRRFETIYPAAGTSNSAVKLTCEELETVSKCCGWVDVCKNGEEQRI